MNLKNIARVVSFLVLFCSTAVLSFSQSDLESDTVSVPDPKPEIEEETEAIPESSEVQKYFYKADLNDNFSQK